MATLRKSTNQKEINALKKKLETGNIQGVKVIKQADMKQINIWFFLRVPKERVNEARRILDDLEVPPTSRVTPITPSISSSSDVRLPKSLHSLPTQARRRKSKRKISPVQKQQQQPSLTPTLASTLLLSSTPNTPKEELLQAIKDGNIDSIKENIKKINITESDDEITQAVLAQAPQEITNQRNFDILTKRFNIIAHAVTEAIEKNKQQQQIQAAHQVQQSHIPVSPSSPPSGQLISSISASSSSEPQAQAQPSQSPTPSNTTSLTTTIPTPTTSPSITTNTPATASSVSAPLSTPSVPRGKVKLVKLQSKAQLDRIINAVKQIMIGPNEISGIAKRAIAGSINTKINEKFKSGRRDIKKIVDESIQETITSLSRLSNGPMLTRAVTNKKKELAEEIILQITTPSTRKHKDPTSLAQPHLLLLSHQAQGAVSTPTTQTASTTITPTAPTTTPTTTSTPSTTITTTTTPSTTSQSTQQGETEKDKNRKKKPKHK